MPEQESSRIAIQGAADESEGRIAIEEGFFNALLGDYTNHTDQQIYIRTVNNTQQLGKFDKVAIKKNQTWAINYITGSDSYMSLLNITPVFYTLELENLSKSKITERVEQFINSTKQ